MTKSSAIWALRAIVIVAALLLSTPWWAHARARVPADGFAYPDRVLRASTRVQKVTPAHMKVVERRLLIPPAAVSQPPQLSGAPIQNAVSVVASFRNLYGVCFNFKSDGTISSHYGSGSVTVTTSGGYLGTPGLFTIFGYTGILESSGVLEFRSFGVTIGPFSIEVITTYSYSSVVGGVLETAGCPA